MRSSRSGRSGDERKSRPGTGGLSRTGHSEWEIPISNMLSEDDDMELFWPFAPLESSGSSTKLELESEHVGSFSSSMHDVAIKQEHQNHENQHFDQLSLSLEEKKEEVEAYRSRMLDRPPSSYAPPKQMLTSAQGIVYLDLLLALSNDESLTSTTKDIVGFIFESWLWMDALWQHLLQDLRHGQVSRLVPRDVFSEKGWSRMSKEIKPKPNVADKLEAVLRMLCFHSRVGKLNETLKRLGHDTSGGGGGGTSSGGHLEMSTTPYGPVPKGKPNIVLPPRRMGELILSREAEEAAGLRVPNDISRTETNRRPLSAERAEKLRRDGIMKSDLMAAQYEFETTGYNRNFRRWISPKLDGRSIHLDRNDDGNKEKSESGGSIAGLHFVCGFPGCGHCTTTALRTKGHYLEEHRGTILNNRSTLKISSKIEHMMAPTWPIDVPWKQEWIREDGRVVGVRLSANSSRPGTTTSTNTQSDHRGQSRDQSRDQARGVDSPSSPTRPSSTRSSTRPSSTEFPPSSSILGPSHVSTNWDKKKTYKPRREALGRPLFCKRSGCRARFLQFNDLYEHQRSHEIHDEREKNEKKQEIMSIQLRHPIRESVERFHPTIFHAFLKCQVHRFLLPNDCILCSRVQEYVQPRLPCMWYGKIKYFILTTGEPQTIDLVHNDQQSIPIVQTRRGGDVGMFPIVVLGVAMDNVGKIWIAGHLMIRLRSLLREGTLNIRDLPKDVDLGLESVEDDVVRFYPLHDVVSWCYVGWCSAQMFHARHAPLPKVMAAPNKCCCRFQLRSGRPPSVSRGEKNKEMQQDDGGGFGSGSLEDLSTCSLENSKQQQQQQQRPSTSSSSVETHPRSVAEEKELHVLL